MSWDMGMPADLEILVLPHHIVQLAPEQDVILRHVRVHQRHLRLVLGVARDLLRDLQHWRQAGAACYLQQWQRNLSQSAACMLSPSKPQ